jgi:exosortase
VFSIVLVGTSTFALCHGGKALAAAAFPFLLLLLMVPVPFHTMDRIISVLQSGSAEATYTLFKLAGVPMFRHGVQFELPGIGIEVAKECSSIHSAWALFITGLLLAHMFLKSFLAKICLSVLTVPIAVFTNAVRIWTLWSLATWVDPGFLFGSLHHKGGILFSLISLSILAGFLCILRKMEVDGHQGRTPGEGKIGFATSARGQAPTLL